MSQLTNAAKQSSTRKFWLSKVQINSFFANICFTLLPQRHLLPPQCEHRLGGDWTSWRRIPLAHLSENCRHNFVGNTIPTILPLLMDAQKLPADFAFLPDMYADQYFPAKQVDKVKAAIQLVVAHLEKGGFTTEDVQEKLDTMTSTINDLQEDFEEHDSEIETGARESIADTVERVLAHFKVAIDIEEALREREW